MQYKNTLFILNKIFFLSFLLLTLAGCVTAPKYNSPEERPSNWAETIDYPELENCFKVSDKLYRCAQPTNKGFKALEKLGIKTVLNLRQLHSDEDKLQGTNLNLVNHPILTMAMDRNDIDKVLSLIEQSEGPVVVHCWHGADRTGTVVAAYRIKKQKWKNEDALEEMLYGGYGYHSIFSNLENLIKEYQPYNEELLLNNTNQILTVE